MPPLTPDDFLALCTFLLIVGVIGGRLMSIWFRYVLARHVDMGPPGRMNAAHLRYEDRAMAGKVDVPPGWPTVLLWILRVLEALLTVGLCVVFYLTYTIGTDERATCISCAIDPSKRSALFWACYGLLVLGVVASRLIRYMVLRHDPRQVEETGRFDGRRFRMGLRMIFTDHPEPKDPLALRLRAVCRWMVFLGIVDATIAATLLVLDR